ncbi:hypothetical protein BdWA1_000732 [Babesia duncani]|uniref:Uncharacterized protein n=1 Tax=Babesia duncani TaxID=323732 RepID=A0AAD9PMQ6_9APIC|nr:hypothetical protein BdWA1_000732 [Babesia duncani]
MITPKIPLKIAPKGTVTTPSKAHPVVVTPKTLIAPKGPSVVPKILTKAKLPSPAPKQNTPKPPITTHVTLDKLTSADLKKNTSPEPGFNSFNVPERRPVPRDVVTRRIGATAGHRTISKDKATNSITSSMQASIKEGVVKITDGGYTYSSIKVGEGVVEPTKSNTSQSDRSTSSNAIGATPWMRIEQRINEIRALANDEISKVSPRVTQTTKPVPNIYNNYKTRYESVDDWKRENMQPLSYTTLQKIKEQRMEQSQKDNWSFLNNFIKPRRKPFANLSEISKCYRNINTQDTCELVKLLLACRDLEKVIEEQHVVLDMLDHDLREAQALLKCPQALGKLEFEKIETPGPTEDPFYPTGNMPIFIKGRVSLLPRGVDMLQPNTTNPMNH